MKLAAIIAVCFAPTCLAQSVPFRVDADPAFLYCSDLLLQRISGYWKFNEGTGTIAYDSSGHGKTGTLSGTTPPSWTTGQKGQCLSFDGATSYVDCGNNFSFTTGSADLPFSVALWAKPLYVSATFNAIIGKYNGTSNVEWSLGHDSATMYINCYITSGSAYIGRTAPFASGTYSNQWVHVAFTYDASAANSGFKIYLNGAAADNGNLSNGTYTNMTAGAVAMNIGRRTLGGLVNFPYKGLLDDVRIYPRVLTSGEIAKLYAQ